MNRPRTWWHLAASRRIPSDYEVVSTRLHYYPAQGFEVATPGSAWMQRHGLGSPFWSEAWDSFMDPRATTYASYCAMQSAREAHVSQVLALEGPVLDAHWIEELDRLLAPSRFPIHALQMLAAYIGSMAPSGKVTIAAMFQAADEMRRLQHVAFRTWQLSEHHPGFGEKARTRWERDPSWQPLRELIERMLVTYDWGEAFCACCLVVKPAFDRFFTEVLADRARAAGDDALRRLLAVHADDAAWHRAWSEGLETLACSSHPPNAELLSQWKARWEPAAAAAFAALGGESR